MKFLRRERFIMSQRREKRKTHRCIRDITKHATMERVHWIMESVIDVHFHGDNSIVETGNLDSQELRDPGHRDGAIEPFMY